MDCEFVRQRTAALAATIANVEAAIDALTVGGIEEYTLDTGQTVQRVKRTDLPRLNGMMDTLLNRLEVLCARCPETAGQAGTLIAFAAKNINPNG